MTNNSIFQKIIQSQSIRNTYARHEQSVGHMAEGYARAAGTPGVALITTGHGLTNMVTPLQDALCDGVALVVICAESPNMSMTGRSGDLDVDSVSECCTKWKTSVKSTKQLAASIKKAFKIASSGRPGPVLVHISDDAHADVPRTLRHNLALPYVGSAHHEVCCQSGQVDVISRVTRLVNLAKRPVLYVGQGLLQQEDGPKILKDFATKACIPVTTSLQGLGAFDEHDPKALHMLGMHGSGYANMAIQHADLILAVGARFDDRVTGNVSKFAPAARTAAAEGRGGIVHFDIAPKNVGKVVAVTESVFGDCAMRLRELSESIHPVQHRSAWFEQIAEWKRLYPIDGYKNIPTHPRPGLIRSQEVIEKLSIMTEQIKHRTIICTGVGQHQMWTAQHFRWSRPRSMITSGGLGTMGFGLPAAIGAQLAKPDCLVVDIDGDASFNMTITELATVAQHNIGVKILLLNNEQMGMISDLQRRYYGGKLFQNRQGNPDFVEAAKAFGLTAQRCTDPVSIESKLEWLLNSEGPALLEVMTEQTDSVYPVVPAGKGLHEFVTYGHC